MRTKLIFEDISLQPGIGLEFRRTRNDKYPSTINLDIHNNAEFCSIPTEEHEWQWQLVRCILHSNICVCLTSILSERMAESNFCLSSMSFANSVASLFTEVKVQVQSLLHLLLQGCSVKKGANCHLHLHFSRWQGYSPPLHFNKCLCSPSSPCPPSAVNNS